MSQHITVFLSFLWKIVPCLPAPAFSPPSLAPFPASCRCSSVPKVIPKSLFRFPMEQDRRTGSEAADLRTDERTDRADAQCVHTTSSLNTSKYFFFLPSSPFLKHLPFFFLPRPTDRHLVCRDQYYSPPSLIPSVTLEVAAGPLFLLSEVPIVLPAWAGVSACSDREKEEKRHRSWWFPPPFLNRQVRNLRMVDPNCWDVTQQQLHGGRSENSPCVIKKPV